MTTDNGIVTRRAAISPRTARSMLEKQKKNRRLTKSVVESYTRDMMNGDWEDTGDPIRFNKKGELVDGQHRLWAIINSNKTQKMNVVKGVSEKAMRAVDTGKYRTYQNHLQIHTDFRYVSAIAGTLRMLWRVKRYGKPLTRGGWEKPTHAELDRMAKEVDMTMLEECAAETLERGMPLPHTLTVFCYYSFYQIDPKLAEEWCEKAVQGTGLERGEPVDKLRRRMIENKGSVTPMTRDAVLALMIKSWNCMRNGTNPKSLVYKPSQEKFPAIM